MKAKSSVIASETSSLANPPECGKVRGEGGVNKKFCYALSLLSSLS